MEESEKCFKAVLLGPTSVGKTSIFLQLTIGTFEPEVASTIGCEYNSITITGSDFSEYQLNLWDTAGQEKYRAITVTYYRNSDFVLLVFSLTDKQTFEDCKEYYLSIKSVIGAHSLILLGNKSDVTQEKPESREVSEQDGNDFAKEQGGQYLEVSARSGSGIDDIKSILGNYCSSKWTNKASTSNISDKEGVNLEKKGEATNNCDC